MDFIKNNLTHIVVVISVSLVIISCENYLEVEPTSSITSDAVFTSTGNADLVLNDIYNGLPSELSSGDPRENFTDNAMNGVAGNYSSAVYRISAYTPSNSPSRWSSYYTLIRRSNIFINKVSASDLNEEWKTQRIAEARFLRAYYYMLLWTHHGGVPIITEALNRHTQGDDIARPRNSSEETYNFIINECEVAFDNLPLISTENGRATKGAALALKGFVELYWASPLNNENNEISRWESASETFNNIIELDVYSLFPDYRTMFLEENNYNAEVIFDRAHLGGTSLGNPVTYFRGPTYVDGQVRAWAFSTPTQDLVDAYQMANGHPISHSNSGYDPQNPYANRSDRFYADIIHDEAEWLGSKIIMKTGVGSENATDISDNNEVTNTGYYWRKLLDPEYAAINNTENSANYILFRYAEVLLSYAEAQNEVNGPDESVYEAINKIRDRVNLPPLTEGLNKEQMREAIRRERRLELAGEGKRWYDLMRWRLAEEKLNEPAQSMVIERENNEWIYKKVPSPRGERIFDSEKNYVFPIPQNAIDQNSKLEQNPGY